MNETENLVPFPLFHGTSSHFLSAFRPGCTPDPWPHKDVALKLLTDAWDILSARRHEASDDFRNRLGWDVNYESIPWYVKKVTDQESNLSNWQHGELYLTPSKRKAVSYACGGARFGGELLTFCKTAIDGVRELDPSRADRLTKDAESLDEFLKGTLQPPILVQFDAIRTEELSAEAVDKDVRSELSLITEMRDILGSEEKALETVGQQTNFRLAKGCGIVTRVFEVHVEDVDHHQPVDPFDLTEIQWSNLT